MISRIWHGYTSHENADVYEQLIRSEIFPAIESRSIKGFKSIQLLRRSLPDETEFITIMLFESLENVKEFAGDNYENAVVPLQAQQVLKRYDATSQHYEVKLKLYY